MSVFSDTSQHAQHFSGIFVSKMQKKKVELRNVEFLKAMIYEHSTIVLVVKFVNEVLQEFSVSVDQNVICLSHGIPDRRLVYCSGY
jgi:hypothetical protein